MADAGAKCEKGGGQSGVSGAYQPGKTHQQAAPDGSEKEHQEVQTPIHEPLLRSTPFHERANIIFG